MRLLLPLVLTQELLSILFCFIQDVSDKNVDDFRNSNSSKYYFNFSWRSFVIRLSKKIRFCLWEFWIDILPFHKFDFLKLFQLHVKGLHALLCHNATNLKIVAVWIYRILLPVNIRNEQHTNVFMCVRSWMCVKYVRDVILCLKPKQ